MRIVNRKGKTKGLRDSIMSWWTAQMQQSSGPVCRMCLQEPGDPEKLGEFLQRDNLRIHYFCLTCFVCKKKGAAIFCQKERCRRNFHLPCGRERGCISQFFGEYKDAAWELEPGAFSELYQRHHHCDAPICLYKDGRDNFENEGRWSLILCTTCGSQGTHRNCSSLRSNSKKWECAECMSTGEIPGCSKTLSPRKDFYRGTGQNGSQEEDPGPSLRERPGPSFLQESSELSSPEKTEPSCWERRRSTWRAKRLKISKHRKKKE